MYPVVDRCTHAVTRPLERAQANETRCISPGSRCPPSHYTAPLFPLTLSPSLSPSASPNGCFLGMYNIRIHVLYVYTNVCVCVCLPPFVTLFPLVPSWSSCCVYVPANGSATGWGSPYQWLCEHSPTRAHGAVDTCFVCAVSCRNEGKSWSLGAAWKFSLASDCLGKMCLHT